MKKTVSIITPCYNGEKFIDRYMNSLLLQDYLNCQLIFIDDGSNDLTKDKFFSYNDRLEKKGFIVEYHYQENNGQAVAIANGLKYVKGDYIIWPDVDDVMPKNSISDRVKFLEINPQYGLVRSDFAVVKEDELNTVIEYGAQKYKEKDKENLFEDCIIGKNIWLQPGCYMIRMSAFDNANPERYIFPSRSGQNWQMLLPVLYYEKCGYIDEALYVYVVNGYSHSHQKNTNYAQRREKLESYEELIANTICHMKLDDEKKYLSLLKCHYSKLKLELAFKNRKRNDAILCLQSIRKLEHPTLSFYIKAYGADLSILHLIVDRK